MVNSSFSFLIVLIVSLIDFNGKPAYKYLSSIFLTSVSNLDAILLPLLYSQKVALRLRHLIGAFEFLWMGSCFD